MKLVVWLFLIVMLTGCSKIQPPDNILSEEQFVDVLVDIHLADGTLAVEGYNVNKDSTTIELLYNDVVKKHNTTQTEIRNTISYYSKNPREFEAVYEIVSEKLAKIESEFEKEKKEKNKKGD